MNPLTMTLMPERPVIGVLALLTSAIGFFGGLGGAIPVLVLVRVAPVEAAPLGMLMVAAGSVGVGAPHLEEGLLNHRIGVLGELGASLGVSVGVLASSVVTIPALMWASAGAALAAAGAMGLRSGIRNKPDPEADETSVGEYPGHLAGAYRLEGGIVPYRVRRVPLRLGGLDLGRGLGGVTGTSGGYLRSPLLSQLMDVPVKVVAATVTFMVGITAGTGLVVYSDQGGLVGGRLDALVQVRVSPVVARRALGAILVTISVLLMLR